MTKSTPLLLAGSDFRATLLNIGCGRRFSRDSRWLNIDLAPVESEVQAVDAAGGLPFENGVFAAVYHSHVLEHLDCATARKLLCECFRILRPGGIIRVAVPDLEQIAASYLEQLAEARAGLPGANRRYNWAVLELCDQMVRRQSGGGMMEYLADREPLGRAYAEDRCGAETRCTIATLDRPRQVSAEQSRPRPSMRAWARRMRESFFSLILGKHYRVLSEGRFVASGELHRWMYDSYSLSIALKEAGFSAICMRSASESFIEEWASFELDADPLGVPHKPDSIYVEACKYPITDLSK